MNIALQPGTSSKPQAITFGPHMRGELLCDFYYGYQYGTLDRDLATKEDFIRAVRSGELVCTAVYEDGKIRFIFGLMCRRDREGHYLDFLFAFGSGINDRILRKSIMQTWAVARAWRMLQYSAYKGGIRVHVNGRSGWIRKLRSVGLVINDDGWVIEHPAGEIMEGIA